MNFLHVTNWATHQMLKTKTIPYTNFSPIGTSDAEYSSILSSEHQINLHILK